MTRPGPAPCAVCGGHDRRLAFTTTVLGHHQGEFWVCRSCDHLVASEAPWLDEAYASAMSAIDTGVVARNIALSARVAGLLGTWFGPEDRFVDMAAGDGLLVRLMRDQGLDFAWDEPYAQNRFAQGFEMVVGTQYAAVTAFEVLEHVLDPFAFLQDCLERSSAETVVFTTELYRGDVPGSDWWYYQWETGQHISFCTRRTLEVLAGRLDATFTSHGGLHVITRADLPEWPLRLAGSRWAGLFSRLVSRRWPSLTGPDSEQCKNANRPADG